MLRTAASQQITLILVLCLWIAINAADGAWIYYYITTSMHPNPNTILNRVHAGWTAFHTLMSFFGFFWGFVNLLVWLVYAGWDARLLVGYVLHRKGRETSWWPPPLNPIFGTRDPTYESALPTKRARNKPKKYGTLRKVFICFVLIPAAIIMVLGPFFGPMIALPWAELVAWDHGCDGYPFQVILHARSDEDPSAIPNVAHFLAGKSPAYTFDINSVATNEWQFNLRTIDSTNLAQNLSALDYPSIRNITYNLDINTVLGSCTSPSSPNATFTCITGSFAPNDYLSFNLTDLRSNTTSYLRAVDKQWKFSDGAPSALIKDEYGVEVLKTDTVKRGDCTQLKMCAAKEAGPDLTVPIGLFLISQIDFARACTQPPPDN